MTRLTGILIAIALIFAAVSGAYGQADLSKTFNKWDKYAAEVKRQIDVGVMPPAAKALREELIQHRAKARVIADEAQQRIAPLKAQIDALGPSPDAPHDEDAQVAHDRRELTRQLADAEGEQKLAELAYTRADRLIESLTQEQRRHFNKQLLTRAPFTFDLSTWLDGAVDLASPFIAAAAGAVRSLSRPERLEVLKEAAPPTLFGAIIALTIVLWLRRWAGRTLRRLAKPRASEGGLTPQPPSQARLLAVGAALAGVRLSLPFMAIGMLSGGLRGSNLFDATGLALVDGAVIAALIVVGFHELAYVYFSPGSPDLRVSKQSDECAAASARLAIFLGVILGIDVWLIRRGDQIDLSINTLAVLNLMLMAAAAAIIWRMARLSCPNAPVAPTLTEEGLEEEEAYDEPLSSIAMKVARRAAYFVAIVGPLAAVAGYFALSRFIFYNFVWTGVLVWVGVILFHVIGLMVSVVAEHPGGGAIEVRKHGRFQLIQVLGGFALCLVAAPLIALIWGATTADLREGYLVLSQGVPIGEGRFSLTDILAFLLIFAIGYGLSRLMQSVVRRSVLPNTRLDEGAKSSIVAGLGYVGVVIAALIAISATGLDLSSLAIVAGALSVGIGFGLQNIVNNFISGLILLVERPIKAGDWIVVGQQQGYVRRVKVRSTEIETFDRATFIVPNSMLISDSVLNWTHSDLTGRVKVPVGVSYKADPRKVEKILHEIAAAHPMLLRRPAPTILFESFGADALNFQIRGFIRDINWVMSVHSDLNFEIARRFGEEGIEIPYPQRDLHIRNVDDLGHALGGRTGGAPPRSSARQVREATRDLSDSALPDSGD